MLDNNKNVVSQNVRLFRVKCGMTQSDLAARLQTMGVNLDQQMISKIEHNTRMVTDYELACICIALHVSPGEMLAEFMEGRREDT